jgi:acyl carrier protein
MPFTNPDTILAELREILVELFELEPEKVVPAARLYEDLGMDSIDAVDLVVHLQKLTGRKIAVETYRTVRTVDDLVTLIAKLVREGA